MGCQSTSFGAEVAQIMRTESAMIGCAFEPVMEIDGVMFMADSVRMDLRDLGAEWVTLAADGRDCIAPMAERDLKRTLLSVTASSAGFSDFPREERQHARCLIPPNQAVVLVRRSGTVSQ